LITFVSDTGGIGVVIIGCCHGVVLGHCHGDNSLILPSGITITDVLTSLPRSSVVYIVSILPCCTPDVTFCTFATICQFAPVVNVIKSPVSLLNIGSIGGFCGTLIGCHVVILIIGLPFPFT